MTREGNGQPVLYRVHLSEDNKTFLRELYGQYAATGSEKAFLQLLRRMYERLRRDPLTFGEPLYRLPALKLLIRQAAIAPLVVVYGVHEEQPHVFIRDFKLLS